MKCERIIAAGRPLTMEGYGQSPVRGAEFPPEPKSHSMSDLMERLVTPALAPIRKVLPLVGGVDLSPLVLLVLLQICTIVLGDVQYGLLAAVAG